MGDVVDAAAPESDWTAYHARITVSHRVRPTLPLVGSDGRVSDTGISLFAETATFPLTSIHANPWSWGSNETLPGLYREIVVDAAWFSRGQSTPFFEVVGRKALVAPD